MQAEPPEAMGARRKGEGRGGKWRKVTVEGGGGSRGGRIPASWDTGWWLSRSRRIPTSGGWLVEVAVAPPDGVLRVAESWGWSGEARQPDPWVGALRRQDLGRGGTVAGSGGGAAHGVLMAAGESGKRRKHVGGWGGMGGLRSGSVGLLDLMNIFIGPI